MPGAQSVSGVKPGPTHTNPRAAAGRFGAYGSLDLPSSGISWLTEASICHRRAFWSAREPRLATAAQGLALRELPLAGTRRLGAQGSPRAAIAWRFRSSRELPLATAWHLVAYRRLSDAIGGHGPALRKPGFATTRHFGARGSPAPTVGRLRQSPVPPPDGEGASPCSKAAMAPDRTHR